MIHKTDKICKLPVLKKYGGYYYYVDLITNSNKAIVIHNAYQEIICCE